MTIADVEFTSAGGIYYSVAQTITFPAEFSINPSTSVSTRTSNLCWAGSVTANTTQCMFSILHSTNVSKNVAVEWQAIGRWK